jgi:hypothetical protein
MTMAMQESTAVASARGARVRRHVGCGGAPPSLEAEAVRRCGHRATVHHLIVPACEGPQS